MQDEEIALAVILAFWPLVLIVSFVICMGIKWIYDEAEYRKWRKELDEKKNRRG